MIGSSTTTWQGSRATDQSSTEVFRVCLAMISAAAGVIHLAAAVSHFDLSALHGAFFIGIGFSQFAAAALLVYRSSSWVLIATVAGNAVILAIWVMSRTTGIPIGPESWTPEPVGIADAVASLFELVLVIGASLMLASSTQPLLAGSGARESRMGLAAGASVLVILTGLALFSSGQLKHVHAPGSRGSTDGSGGAAGAAQQAAPAPLPAAFSDAGPAVEPTDASTPTRPVPTSLPSQPAAAKVEPYQPAVPSPPRQVDQPAVEAPIEGEPHSHEGDGHQGHE